MIFSGTYVQGERLLTGVRHHVVVICPPGLDESVELRYRPHGVCGQNAGGKENGGNAHGEGKNEVGSAQPIRKEAEAAHKAVCQHHVVVTGSCKVGTMQQGAVHKKITGERDSKQSEPISRNCGQRKRLPVGA